MAKEIMFSRYFPLYHTKAKQATYFPERILQQQKVDYFGVEYRELLWELNANQDKEKLCEAFWESLWDLETGSQEQLPKSHTIRGGWRFKKGEKFSPKIWTGRPYNSPKIQFLPDMEIKSIWAFEITPLDGIVMPEIQATTHIEMVANNDGLTLPDFKSWFKNFIEPSVNQIICWNENINY